MKPIPILAALVLAGGCAGYSGAGLQPGAPETQVRSMMGTPALEMRDPDGTRHLYYPKGPLGNHTYVADIGADVTFRCHTGGYILLVYGRLPLDRAVDTGRLEIEGNRAQALLFSTLFQGV